MFKRKEGTYYARPKVPMNRGTKYVDPIIYKVEVREDKSFTVQKPESIFCSGASDLHDKMCLRDWFNHVEIVTERDFLSQLTISRTFFEVITDMTHESRIAKSLVRYMDYVNANDQRYRMYMKMFSASEINFITMRGSEVSFLPKGKPLLYNESGTWKRDGRQTGKPSKVIRKLLTKNALKLFKEADFEVFNNVFKARTEGADLKIEIWPSSRIPEVYDMRRASGGSSLDGSCMNGDSEYYDMLKGCPNVRIVVALNQKGELAARALLWELEVKVPDLGTQDVTYMDRIYVAEDWMYDRMLEFRQEHKFWGRTSYKTMDDKRYVTGPDGKEYSSVRLMVDVDQDHSRYPYMDTLAYGDGSSLSNMSIGDYEYMQTDGSRSGGDDDDEQQEDDSMYCPVNEEHYDIDEMTYVERGRYRDQYIYHRDVVTVEGHEYWKEDDLITYSQHESDYILTNDAVYSKHHEDWLRTKNATYVESENDYILTSDVVTLADGEYHIMSDACKIGNEWHKEEDCVLVDGRYELKLEEAA